MTNSDTPTNLPIPLEVYNLFNPAFCATLIHQMAVGYRKHSNNDIPYLLLFIMFPMVLHKATRDRLPKSLATKFHPWSQNHQEVQIGFSKHITSTSKYMKSGLIFGLKHKILILEENAKIKALHLELKDLKIENSEASICISKALFLGRWFSTAGDVSTILSVWNIRI